MSSVYSNELSPFPEEEEPYEQVVSDHTRYLIVLFTSSVVCPIICILGLVTNLINVLVFVKMGFGDTVNISFLALAISDFVGLLVFFIVSIGLSPLFVYLEVPAITIRVMYVQAMHWALGASRTTGLITAYITLERCLSVTFPITIKTLLTPRRTAVFLVLLFVYMIAITTQVTAMDIVVWIVDPVTNATVPVITSYEAFGPRIPLALVNSGITMYLSIIVVGVCTIIIIMRVRANERRKQTVKAAGGLRDSAAAPELSKKVMGLIKMVILIASVFVITGVPGAVLPVVFAVFPEMTAGGKEENIQFTLNLTLGALAALNSSTNFFIYFKMGSRYRATFYAIFPGCTKK